MAPEAWRVLSNPVVVLMVMVLFAAIAVSGKFSRVAAYALVMIAWLIGMFLGWSSHDQHPSHRLSGTFLLTAVSAGIVWWTRKPGHEIRLRIQDIQVLQLPKRPGEILKVALFLENISSDLIKTRNIVWAQTRLLPADQHEEIEVEAVLWNVVAGSLESHGRDLEIPTTGTGGFNQVLESNPFGVEELRSFASGTHAVYFGAIFQDRRTKKNLIELLIFVRNIGVIHFCSQHNKP